MKKLIFLAVLTTLTLSKVIAQTPKYKLEGNTITAISNKTKTTWDSTTTYKYTNTKGVTLPVFVSRNGSYYTWVVSKNNKPYKKYLKF